jgi:hypothetical protein
METAIKSAFTPYHPGRTPNATRSVSTEEKKKNTKIYDIRLYQIDNNFKEPVIFSKEPEYVLIETGNDVSTDNSSLKLRVGAIMALPPIFTESFALAKGQVQNDMVKDAKSIGTFALLSSLFSSVFNISFLVILVFIIGMAFIEYIFSLMKRFRLEGVDYSPIAKIQLLIGAFILFLAAAFLQVGVNYLVTTQIEQSPEWLSVVKQYLNIKNTTGLFILGFYMNTIRKMFSKATGVKDATEAVNAPSNFLFHKYVTRYLSLFV